MRLRLRFCLSLLTLASILYPSASYVTPRVWASSPPDSSVEDPSSGVFVVDQAQLIHSDSKERMSELLKALLRDTDIELMAISIPTLNGLAISAFANELFERWGIGSRTQASRGLLFVVAAREQRVRFEVSYELESIFTDSFVSYIEQKQMIPYFEHNQIGEGIEATVELIARRAYERVLNKTFDPTAKGPEDIGGYKSGGAGADTAVTFGSSSPRKPQDIGVSQREVFDAQPTPADAWERFLEVNRRHIKDPEIGLYDDLAKALMRGVSTDAGQDHIAQLYAGKPYTVREKDSHAAIVFSEDSNNLLAPWFFHKTAQGWQLDGSMYPEVIGYNHLNQWFFKRRDHPYMFAFSDYTFDKHGFAFYRSGSGDRGGYLGVEVYWYDYEGQGVLVYGLMPGSPAEKAGLEIGDFILSYNKEAVLKPAELTKRIRADAPGKTVELGIVRGALQESLTLRLDDGSLVEVHPTRKLNPPQRLTISVILGKR